MRLFLAYGYNDRDHWVEELVFPVAEALGWTIDHGLEVFGGPLPETIRRKIAKADALIGFATRRQVDGSLSNRTHPWVEQELTMAQTLDPSIPYVVVREEGVDPLSGFVGTANYQEIRYSADSQARCLKDVVRALRHLADLTNRIKVKLSINGVAEEELGRLVGHRSFVCEFRKWNEERFQPDGPFLANARQEGGSLFVKLNGVIADDLVSIRIQSQGKMWESQFEPLDTIKMVMKAVD